MWLRWGQVEAGGRFQVSGRSNNPAVDMHPQGLSWRAGGDFDEEDIKRSERLPIC